jgi:hypothetical protein
MDTKQITWHSGLLQSASRLHPVHITVFACWQCWNNPTSLTLRSVKLSRLCPTIKGSKSLAILFKSVSCKIFEHCLFTMHVRLVVQKRRHLFREDNVARFPRCLGGSVNPSLCGEDTCLERTIWLRGPKRCPLFAGFTVHPFYCVVIL